MESGGGMIIGPLMMLGVFALFIVSVVAIIRWIVEIGRTLQNSTTKSAVEILNERFAKDEIEKEEYEDRKNVLLS